MNTAITKTEIAITRNVTNGIKQCGKNTVLKTTQVAERYVAKGGTPSLDALSKAGQVLDRNGLTKAGRALQKHSIRPKTVFTKANNKAIDLNEQGQFYLDNILTHPKSKITRWEHRSLGKITDIEVLSSGGMRFSENGNFIGFLQP